MNTPTTTKPGALALARLEHEAGEKFIGSKPQPKTALADLRALIARCEQAEAQAERLAEALHRLWGIDWSHGSLAHADAMKESESALAAAREALEHISRHPCARYPACACCSEDKAYADSALAAGKDAKP